MARRQRQPRQLSPAAIASLVILGGFLVVFCAATRWGLDLYGPWLAHTLGWTK
jgi:hypothetical protein